MMAQNPDQAIPSLSCWNVSALIKEADALISTNTLINMQKE
jgi:hypothetical protein